MEVSCQEPCRYGSFGTGVGAERISAKSTWALMSACASAVYLACDRTKRSCGHQVTLLQVIALGRLALS